MSDRKRVLVSWVGYADLRGLAAAKPQLKKAVEAAIRGTVKPDQAATGPLHVILNHEEFDEVHLIAAIDPKLLKQFGQWLGKHVRTTGVEIANPTDYTLVYNAAEDLLSTVKGKDEQPDLWINLTSGTPSMTATLVLLGKTRFPARFIQTYKNDAQETNVPFDLTLEYLPELLREPDAMLQYLADRSPVDIAGFGAIVGNSPAIKLAVGRAERAAIRDVSVLLVGESGTGKELFANAIHAASARRDKPFIAINGAAIPRELQESELFGHKVGSFTGAKKDRKGAFRQANGGTLFLDEFGELDARTQAALLRALQPGSKDPPCKRTFRPVGAEKDETADVRIIAATNQDPMQLIKSGQLRADLFYRVATITLNLPTLRGRKSDIITIATSLLDRINREFDQGEPGYEHKSLSGAAKGFVSRHNWPGNVRELNNVLVQAAVMSTSPTIGKAEIEAALSESPLGSTGSDILDQSLGDGFDLQKCLDDIAKRFLERAMEESTGVKAKAAELLGLKTYQTLDGKIKKLGIKWKRK